MPVRSFQPSNDYVERFSKLIQARSDGFGSDEQPLTPEAKEAQLQSLLDLTEQLYPKTHQTLEILHSRPLNRIYLWHGKNGPKQINGEAKSPVILAHYDVVPIEKELWTEDPFGGEVKDGFIYGRGTLDDKCSYISIFEALETLISQSFQPENDIYFAFGGDEESFGSGARNSAQWFKEHNIKFSFVNDEGGDVMEGFFPGIKTPLAFFNVVEKGFVSLELKVHQTAGHSSAPPKKQAVGQLAKALAKLEDVQVDYYLDPVVVSMMKGMAPYFDDEKLKTLYSEPETNSQELIDIWSQDDKLSAFIHTTKAMTMLRGSKQDNVMPNDVSAVLNFRLLPKNTPDSIAQWVKDIIQDPEIEVLVWNEHATPATDAPDNFKQGQGFGFDEVKEAFRKIEPDIPVIPGIITGGTDARFFSQISDGIVRFVPYWLTPEEMRFHGNDERVSLENIERSNQFYQELFKLL